MELADLLKADLFGLQPFISFVDYQDREARSGQLKHDHPLHLPAKDLPKPRNTDLIGSLV